LDTRFDEDLDLNPAKFGLMKHLLSLIFPDLLSIKKDFLVRLTPEELKQAYIQQAAYWHPKNAENLDQKEREARSLRYRRLSLAYKGLLPHVTKIHQAVRQMESCQKEDASRRTILAVGGAKGGVGKSVLAANLAVALALTGQKVILADLDMGGADAHLLLGVKSLSIDWNDFLERRVRSLGEILTTTPFQGLSLIGGNSSKLGSANLTYLQKLKIVRQLKTLECDYVVLDLGGDTSFNMLDFFLLADQKIVVTAAEPASFLDSYNFVKVSFYRFLDRFFAEHGSLKDLRGQIRKVHRSMPGKSPLETIFKEVQKRDPSAYFALRQHVDRYRLSLVVNMAETRKDSRIAESMQRLLEMQFFPDVGILGTVPFDAAVRKASRRFTPFVVDDPRSKASQVLYQMLAGILFLHEPSAIRSQLLEKTRLIRREVKDRIGGNTMTLDALTSEQIRFVSGKSPSFRDGLGKILRMVQD
jgi:flagellar biosynthesis protein FlhG